jgi:aspartyl-tRNA(Asn)/glutamyl-tRNA(Gln) amidotransferase subunit A
LRALYIPRFGAAPVDPEVAAAVDAFAARLERDGHQVQTAPAFFDLVAAARVWHVVSRAGVAWLMRENPSFEAKTGAVARAMAAEGRAFAAADYFDALDKTTALRRLSAELFTKVDIVLTPTAAALPWPAEAPYPEVIAGRPAGPRDHAVFTGWVNIAGVPGISLPLGLSRSGLPIGAQLVAAFGADDALLAFARAIATDIPPLPVFED